MHTDEQHADVRAQLTDCRDMAWPQVPEEAQDALVARLLGDPLPEAFQSAL
ncbi:hypothetical protein [Streptomyces sp. NPDC008141]|uniref:hypothetical protein n=1 Tax=Streptomyces sp. NPDC008141 TaxID=3364815 RepID=UPI0036E387DA